MSIAISLKSLAAAAFVLMPEDGENLPEKTKEAYLLYRSGQTELAVKAFGTQAKGGDPAAMFALGALVKEGKAQGMGEAEGWFRAAAQKDYAPAQYNLALLLAAGRERTNEAKDWMRRAAESGSKKAMLQVGINYLEGTGGLKQSPELAFDWLGKAHGAKVPEAGYYLGRMHQAGFGIAKDLPKALALMSAAADADVEKAVLYLAGSYLNGGLGETSVEKALAIYRRGASELGSADCKATLGGLYEAGEVVDKDYKKALLWYEQAASGGHYEAYNKLGFFHERGLGVEKDEGKALEFYQRGAGLGVPVSMYNVAQMLDAGKGVDAPDPVGAARHLHKAATAGMTLSQFELAMRYMKGEGLMADATAAAAWFERAAVAGMPTAQFALAELYERGEGIPKNMPRSAHWYQTAARQGHAAAMFRMGELYESGTGTGIDLVKAMAFYEAASAGEYEPAVKRRAVLAEILDESQMAAAKVFREAGFRTATE